MAKHRKGRRHGKGAIPLAVVLPAAIPAVRAYRDVGGFNKALPEQLALYYTGVRGSTGTFESGYVTQMAMPIIAGIIIHKAASKLGINRHVTKLTGGLLSI